MQTLFLFINKEKYVINRSDNRIKTKVTKYHELINDKEAPQTGVFKND